MPFALGELINTPPPPLPKVRLWNHWQVKKRQRNTIEVDGSSLFDLDAWQDMPAFQSALQHSSRPIKTGSSSVQLQPQHHHSISIEQAKKALECFADSFDSAISVNLAEVSQMPTPIVVESEHTDIEAILEEESDYRTDRPTVLLVNTHPKALEWLKAAPDRVQLIVAPSSEATFQKRSGNLGPVTLPWSLSERLLLLIAYKDCLEEFSTVKKRHLPWRPTYNIQQYFGTLVAPKAPNSALKQAYLAQAAPLTHKEFQFFVKVRQQPFGHEIRANRVYT